MVNFVQWLLQRLRNPGDQPRSHFSLLLPLLLVLFPRTADIATRDGSWIKKPLPMEARAIQARRVRILLRASPGPLRVEGSAWGGPIVVRFDSRRVEIRSLQDGQRLAVGSGHRLEAATGSFLRLDGVPYRGVLEIFYNPNREPVIVNELSLEDYLKGVVPLELGPVQFPFLEAQKVQSVAARSYSLRHLGSWAHHGFDLYADVRSQVYGGIPAEKELSNLALLETRGLVSVASDQPILAYYSSTCGGRTAPAVEAFGQQQQLDYLRGGVECPDESSPYHTWEARFSLTDFLDKLGVVETELEAIEPHRYPAGRLKELDILTRSRKQTVSGTDLRRSLGLRSTWLTELELSREEVLIRGQGFGHGVGLCQFGSVELARRGRRAEDILKHYYPGSSLLKVY